MKARKKDANHHEIVKEFEKLGYQVDDMTAINKFCDSHIAKMQRYAYIEIKDGKKPPSQRKLTSGESAFADKCRENNVLWFLCESIEDVHKIDDILTQLYHDGEGCNMVQDDTTELAGKKAHRCTVCKRMEY